MTRARTPDLYQQYLDISQKAADFNNAAALLSWDQEVYMPKKGFEFRGRQLATLSAAAHELLTSESFGALLEELYSRTDLGEAEAANVRLSYEDYRKSRKLSTAFIEKLTLQTSESYNAWLEARNLNDYKRYAPALERMIALKQEQASLYGYSDHPYDALLDDYERGATTKLLDGVFAQVKTELPPLLDRIRSSRQVSDDLFRQHFPRDLQFSFSMQVLEAMGYDLEAGRQDYSEHPFSISFAPTDVRVTTRVSEQDLSSLLWSSIHEGGHALYEQGLPVGQYGLPLGTYVSLSIHESQSRLWENCVGRSLSFWKHFYPRLQALFPGQLGGYEVEEFYKAANKVEASPIRTEADELTYHFHVLIRYEIEKAVIGGEVRASELKDVWNEYYGRYLGIVPEHDKEGILQDVHWSHGSFGYFPTYSLGSFYAAQFFGQASKDVSGLGELIAQGQYAPLLGWLRENVHCHGRKYSSEDLCRRITGNGLEFSSFMRYAKEKYSGIYNVVAAENVV